MSKVVASCSDGLSHLRLLYPQIDIKMNFQVLHLVEYLDQLIKEGKIAFSNKVPMKVTYHDPCHLGLTRACEEVWAMPYDMTQADPDMPIRMFLSEERTSGTYDRPPGPEMFAMMLVIEADTEAEMKARAGLLEVIMKEELKDALSNDMPAGPFDLSTFPSKGMAARL